MLISGIEDEYVMAKQKPNYHDLAWQVSDPIHGTIEVSNLEAAVIDSRPFQRLRKVKQLGNVHLVFPGAVHNRFGHSIGVMHVAGKMFDALFKNTGTEALHNNDVKELRILVRLAGLLHDVGHGPFSHTFESCLKHKENDELVRSTVNQLDQSLQIPKNWIDERKQDEFFDAPLQHEYYSFGLIKYIFSKVDNLHETAHDVCSLLDERIIPSARITQLFEKVAATVFHGANPTSLRRCLKAILSGELDADRLDYLQRDSYYCGVSIASIDTDYILNSISLAEHRKRQQSGNEKRELYISISKSALPAFEQVLISRKQMYDRVYHHRVNSGFDYLLECLVDYLMQNKKGGVKLPTSVEGFLQMTDDWLESKILEVANSQRPIPVDIKLAAQLFTARAPLKKLESFDVKEGDVEKEKSRLEDAPKSGKGSNKKIIFAKKLSKLTSMPRDSGANGDAIIMIKPEIQGASPRSLSDESEVLGSTAWRDIKSRIFVFESLKKTALLRNLPSKL